jgi:serine/threonine protein kinase
VDHRSRRYVVLKTLLAKMAKLPNESKILRHLARTAGLIFPEHVVALLDGFKHRSPNGNHLCFVFELMGPCVNHMLEELAELPAASLEQSLSAFKGRYPLWIAKRMLKQILQALKIMHQNGIAHGDLHSGNILFSLKSLEHIENGKMCQDKDYKWGSISDPPVKRKDDKVDRWAPRYLAVPQPLAEFANIGPEFRVKLSDLGGG